MHKIFAKPLFLGKKVVFLPQCHSTNEEMIQKVRNGSEPEGFVIYTDFQLQGRGQRGNKWVAESGQSILMSILLRPRFLQPLEQFNLNLVAGLAVVDALESRISGKVQLKWPNDVYVNERKIAGILVENTIRGSKMELAVVGIGLNVMQEHFDNLAATSLRMEQAEKLDKADLMEDIVLYLESWYTRLKAGKYEEIRKSYLTKLRWLEEERLFESAGGEFQGCITGIDSHGLLEVNVNGQVRVFDVKEIRFVR